MRNFGLTTLLIFVGGLLCWWGLPWWTIVLWAGLAGLLSASSVAGVGAAGFAAGSLLWYGAAMAQHLLNAGRFADTMGQVFSGLSAWQLLAATGLLGGLLAGLGAMTGRALAEIFVTPQRKRSPYAKRRRR